MKNQHIVIRSSLIAFALFFSAYTIAFGNIYINFGNQKNSEVLGAQTDADNEKDLVISSEISNIIEQDGLIQVTYKFSAKNTKEKPITDLKLQSDFSGTFPSDEFSIQSITSAHNFNPDFDGLTNIDLFKNFPVLEPGNIATVDVTILFDPNGFEGPFENNIFASGLYDGEEIKNETQTGNNAQNQNNTNTNTQPTTTTTNPSGNTTNNNSDKPKDAPKETNFSERDIKVSLVDVTTKQEIIEISGGEEIIFEQGDNPFTLKVDVNPGTVGSVVFGLNGNDRYRVENSLPYAIINNSLNSYDAWYPAPGTYTLTLTVYSQDGGKGEILGEKEVTFTLAGEIPSPQVVQQEQEAQKETVLAVTESSAKSSFTITLKPVEQSTENNNTEEEATNTNTDIDSDASTTDDTDEVEEVDEVPDNQIPTSTNTNSNNSNLSGVSIFDNSLSNASLGQISGVSVQSNPININNPFEEEGSVNGLSASGAAANAGNVLAVTGINVSQTILIGLIIMIGVIELNAFRTEKKFIENLAHHKSLL